MGITSFPHSFPIGSYQVGWAGRGFMVRGPRLSVHELPPFMHHVMIQHFSCYTCIGSFLGPMEGYQHMFSCYLGMGTPVGVLSSSFAFVLPRISLIHVS